MRVVVVVSSNFQLLQVGYPDLYRRLKEGLLAFNIHSYDVRATCRSEDNKIEIKVMFGEEFSQERKEVFSKNIFDKTDRHFENFCEKVGEACKETLIADYFKMVSP